MDNDALLSEAMESEPEFSSFTEEIRVKLKRAIHGWPVVNSALEKHALSATLNHAERSITVTTTARTNDPDIINMARDCIAIFCNTKISPQEAIKVLNGEVRHEYIKIGFQEDGIAAIHGMKKKRYEKNAKRLFQHIKNIGILVRCPVYIGEECVVFTCAELCSDRLKYMRLNVENFIVGKRSPATYFKEIKKSLIDLQQCKLEERLQNMVI